jgi:prefoldin subunit 5
MKLNEVINKLKKNIDEISTKLEKAQREFKEVRAKRKDIFLN